MDVLSGGRFDLGLGLGWSDEEYRASGASKRHQGRRAEEFLAVIRTLWTDEERRPRRRVLPHPAEQGRTRSRCSERARPSCSAVRPPTALARAGRLADGWVSSSRARSAADRRVDSDREGRGCRGRVGIPEALRYVCRGVVKVRTTGERAPLMGTLDEIRSDFDLLAEHGVTEVFVDLNFDSEIGSPDADPVASCLNALTRPWPPRP